MAVTEGLVREEQLLHDMCLLGAMTVEITQILTRAGLIWLKYIWTPLKMEPGLVMWWSSIKTEICLNNIVIIVIYLYFIYYSNTGRGGLFRAYNFVRFTLNV